MSTSEPQPTEEELRAAYEAEVKRLRIEHVLLEQVVTVVNLGMRKTGIAPGTEDERDPEQVRLAIDSIRALMPLLERAAPEQVGPIRDAVSQLQLAYVRIGGGGGGAGGAAGAGPETGGGAGGGGSTPPDPEPPPAPAAEPGKPGEPGPAQRSGRLWVPGQ